MELWRKKWVLRHCDLDLWPKVTKFNKVRASVWSSHVVKTVSKSVHPFRWYFVHKKCRTHRQTHTYTQTNWSENITPPRFRGGVKKKKKKKKKTINKKHSENADWCQTGTRKLNSFLDIMIPDSNVNVKSHLTDLGFKKSFFINHKSRHH